MRIGRIMVGASALAAAGVLVAPGVAAAHDTDASASCAGWQASVSSYPDTAVTTITIDGVSTTYRGDGSWSGDWDQTTSHTWSVSVRDPGYDRDFGGTQPACIEPTTTTTPGTTTTIPGATTTTTAPAGTPTTTPGATSTTVPTASSGGGGSGSSSSGTGTPRAAATGTLPATGPSVAALTAVIATILTGLGGAFWAIARRRTA